MTEEEALAHITLQDQYCDETAHYVPTCGMCGGWGLGYASVEHHHTCKVAAAIVSYEPILATDEHWVWLGHTLPIV